MHNAKKSRRTALKVFAICSTVAVALYCVIFPLYPVEERSLNKNGSVHYERLWVNRSGLWDWEDGLEKNAGFHGWIRQMVYGSTAVYVFSWDGQVFALSGNEWGVPASVVETWKWKGNPRMFPYYDKEYPSSCP